MSSQRKAVEMFPLIEEWQQSGESQKSFAKGKGLKLNVFLYWLKRFRQQEDKISRSAFIDLKITQQQQETISPLAEVELSNGQRLRFSREIAAEFFDAYIKSQGL